jgi:hypothetical protein
MLEKPMRKHLKAIEDLAELSECEDVSAFERESVVRLSKIYGSATVFVEFSPSSMRVVGNPADLERVIALRYPGVAHLMATQEKFLKHFYKRNDRFPLPITHAELQSNRDFWNSGLYADFYRHLERGRYAANFALAQIDEAIFGYVILRSTTVPHSETGFSEFERRWQPVARARLAQAFAGLMKKKRAIPGSDEIILQRVSQLSPREKDVIGLMANSKAGEDIAATLGISIKTVAIHKTHILDRVFFEERQEVDAAALSAGEKLKHKLRLASAEGKELRTVLNRHFSRLKPILGRAADWIQ